jgi:hypothetical protein
MFTFRKQSNHHWRGVVYYKGPQTQWKLILSSEPHPQSFGLLLLRLPFHPPQIRQAPQPIHKSYEGKVRTSSPSSTKWYSWNQPPNKWKGNTPRVTSLRALTQTNRRRGHKPMHRRQRKITRQAQTHTPPSLYLSNNNNKQQIIWRNWGGGTMEEVNQWLKDK